MSGRECNDFDHCECVSHLYEQINELRGAVSNDYKLLPDGEYGEDIVKVKKVMTAYECWPYQIEKGGK